MDFSDFFFGRRRLKKHSEKTEDARPKREQRKREKARERASGGTRKSAALSRLVTKRELAHLSRAREFVAKFWTRKSKFSRKGGEITTEDMCGDFRKLCEHRPKESAEEGRNLKKAVVFREG